MFGCVLKSCVLGNLSKFFQWKCALQSFKLNALAFNRFYMELDPCDHDELDDEALDNEAFDLLLYADDNVLFGPKSAAKLYQDFCHFERHLELDENVDQNFKSIYLHFQTCFQLTARRGVVRFISNVR